jgi:bifunctional non-homologous end joining protein LigD
VLPDGRTSLHAMGGDNLVFFAFDLLHVDGEDLFELPLEERKVRLAALLGDDPPAPFRYVEHHVGDGARFFNEACAMRLEGIVSKARAAPYKSGARNATWRKVKCVLRQEFVIGGYEPSVVGGLGSLWLGTYDDAGRLEFAGKVGTGFQREAPALMKKLAGMKQATTPFDAGMPVGAAKQRDAHWVEPTLVCEVAFMEWTGHGHIRHASFQGMRADKKARDVKREVSSEAE